MLKSLTVLTAALMIGGLAHAESATDRKACVDDAGGTYTLAVDGSIKCENGLCALKAPTSISQLHQTKTVESATVTESENQLAITLNMLVGHKESSIIEGGTPAYFSNGKTTLFCSSAFSMDDYESQNIQGTLSGFPLN